MSAIAEIRWSKPDAQKSASQPEPYTLMQHAPFAWAQCRRDGTFAAMNSALETMLPSLPKLSRALRFADLIPPQDRAEAESLLEDLFGKKRDSFLLNTQRFDGTDRPLRWNAWRIAGANENPDSAMLLAEEIPNHAEADQRLRQAERLEVMGRLAGGVAHDFNNLLTGVLLYCDLLMAHLEPCHRVRKYAEEIRKAGVQASGLVQQLLAVSRPAKNEPRLLSLNEVAEGMRNLLLRLTGENIELKFQLDPNLGLIHMDPTHAQQVLLNLVLNARDAMPGGGAITIETRNCKMQVLPDTVEGTFSAASLPCALFVVADNGCGMDAATRAHVFEAFYTTKGTKGTGLGLPTVHDIVTRSGGLIHIESAPQQGTRVSVLLPLVRVPAVSSDAKDCPETNREVLQLQS